MKSHLTQKSLNETEHNQLKLWLDLEIYIQHSAIINKRIELIVQSVYLQNKKSKYFKFATAVLFHVHPNNVFSNH